jgi:CRISPR system Cascade subunit CasA
VPSECSPASFDLTTRPWLPVLRDNGSEDELSLLEVFEEAHRLRGLVGDIPTQEFALLRLLLAILHDAVQGPADLDEWEKLWTTEESFHAVPAYLAKHRASLDLLGVSRPFMQVPDLRTGSGEVASLDRIVADVPNGDRFFTMRARGAQGLSFAEAARWLVHAHAFDSSGIKSGAVGDPRVKGGRGYPQGVSWSGNLGGVFAEGGSLRETLLLNLVAADTTNLRSGDLDRPAWRAPQQGPAPTDEVELARRPYGVRDLYTWQSRRLRLHYGDEGVHGVVLAYGDPLHPRNRHDSEPMTAWRRSPVQEKKLRMEQVYLPRAHDPSRSAWRGLGALVTGQMKGAEQRREAAHIVRPRILDWVARLISEDCLPRAYPLRARLVGAVYGTQQSVIDEVVDDSVTMPVVLLHRDNARLGQSAVDAAEDADNAVQVLGELAEALAEAAGGDGQPSKATARDRGYAALDAAFRAWLREIPADADPAQVRRKWQTSAHRITSRIAEELVDEVGSAAWEGRVVTTKRGQLWLNDAQAAQRFHAKLKEVLPMSAERTDRPTSGESVITAVRAQQQGSLGLVGAVVDEFLTEIQKGYLDDKASSVARLAQLRRGAGKAPHQTPELWGLNGVAELYAQGALEEEQAEKAEAAVHMAVTLYALHQQSQRTTPMHVPGVDLGTAVRQLMPTNRIDDPIRMRFVRVGTAATPDLLVDRLREIVTLLRRKQVPLDYGLLADRLHRFQQPGGMREVRQHWGRSFHSYRPGPAAPAPESGRQPA